MCAGLFLSVSACGGGNSSSANSSSTNNSSSTDNSCIISGNNINTCSSNVPGGIYKGTATSYGGTPEKISALIMSDGRAIIGTEEGNKTWRIMGRIYGRSLNGKTYTNFNKGGTPTVQVTSVSGNNISGRYIASFGVGTFALVADPELYNRGSSLSKLEGTWLNTGTNKDTLVIQVDGRFTLKTTSLSCKGEGAITIFNKSKNEYNLSVTNTGCPTTAKGVATNGIFTGYAVVFDTNKKDDTILLISKNDTSGSLLTLALLKQ